MILTAGLSPAWQQILVFHEVTTGEVNRAMDAHWCASGKVLNVAGAIHSLGEEVDTVCPVGGPAGDAIRAEFNADRIPATWIDTASATRICTTIIEQATGRVTEFVENARAITADELSEFEFVYQQAAGSAQIAVLTGSLPEIEGHGKPVERYRRLLKVTVPSILDVRGPELLAALPERPLLVKPNREELAATCGRSLGNELTVLAAMKELNELGAQWVLVTSGSGDVLLTSASAEWRLVPFSVDVVNPIGCGDCLAAGIAVAVSEGVEMVDAARFGMAAAAQNASQLLPARLDRRLVDQQAIRVHVNSL